MPELWREELLDLPFQYPALLEIDDSLGGYRDLLPGSGIPALSWRPGSDPENAEVPEFDGIPGGQSLLHGRQEEIDRHLGIFFSNPRELAGQALFQIGLCHRAPSSEILFFGQDSR